MTGNPRPAVRSQGDAARMQHEADQPDFDFWHDCLGLVASYNSAVDDDIFAVASLIVEARANNGFVYCDEIAKRLNLSATHVELIQYILAGVRVGGKDAFNYGTSPRGLWASDAADAFMALYRRAYEEQWGATPHAIEQAPSP